MRRVTQSQRTGRSATKIPCAVMVSWALSFGLLAWPVPGAVSASSTEAKRDRGFAYYNDDIPSVPWSIHVFKLTLGQSDLELCTTLGNGVVFGMSTVSDQLRALPAEAGQPIAAVNGDFYRRNRYYQGHPRGLQIRLGELVSSPADYVCFWMDAAGKPHMTNIISGFKVTWDNGTTTPFDLNEERRADDVVLYTSALGRSTYTSGGLELVLEQTTDSVWLPLRVGVDMVARVREIRPAGNTPLRPDLMVLSIGPRMAPRLPPVRVGSLLRLATDTIPDLAGAKVAIGGGPTLVRDGKPMQWSGWQMRHPRTALGWNKEFLFLVEVDGRQGNLSVGMTLPELAAYMVKLGCEQAMNMDGGGSATMWVMGTVMNSPSEGRERPSPNALVVVQKKPPKTKVNQSPQ